MICATRFCRFEAGHPGECRDRGGMGLGELTYGTFTLGPPPSTATTAYDGARWLAKHAEHRLAHNVRGFRCLDCTAAGFHADCVWLTAADWNEVGLEVGVERPPKGNPTREEAIANLEQILIHAFELAHHVTVDRPKHPVDDDIWVAVNRIISLASEWRRR